AAPRRAAAVPEGVAAADGDGSAALPHRARGLHPAHTHRRERRLLLRAAVRQAVHVHAQERVRDPVVADLRRAAGRPLPARLAREKGGALDAGGILHAAAGLRGQQVRARDHPPALTDEIPLSWLYVALGVMLASSGFFSGSETCMMALNRYRLQHLVREGSRGARLASALLQKTDELLAFILAGNTII